MSKRRQVACEHAGNDLFQNAVLSAIFLIISLGFWVNWFQEYKSFGQGIELKFSYLFNYFKGKFGVAYYLAYYLI